MAYFKLITFGGLAPRISPRLLKDNLAQTATDVNLESGRLVPITGNSDTLTLSNSSRQSIFKYTDSPERWLQFDDDVDVELGPIAGDTNNTAYWTGDGGFPKMGRSSDIIAGSVYPNNSYRLGIPAPTAAPTVAAVAATTFDGLLTTTNGSSTVTITTETSGAAAAHSLSVNEHVKLTGFSTTNGISATAINGSYRVKAVPTTTTFTLELSEAATASGNSSVISNGVEIGGNSEADLDYETSYVYTFVSAYGEEGPPSAASTVITTDDNMSVSITGLETSHSKSNLNLSKKRIYRSNTGSNTTAFQFVAEVTLATTSYTDTSRNSELAELIPSTYWIGPPDDDTSLYPDGPMKGLVALPGGVFAGFTGKRVCFSEPFLPHAWPAAYRVTLEEEVVGIEVAGNGVIVGTKGTPYLITGSDPQSMTAIRMEAGQACLNKRSMVDMGPFVMYAGPDGLVAAAGTDVRILTESILSPSQWQASYYPATMTGFLWEGRYVGFYTTGSGYGGFIFDPREGVDGALVDLDASALIRGGFTDPDDSQLYLIIANKIEKFQGSSTAVTYNWKSKEYVPPRPTSMGFLKVDAEAYPVTLKVYGDGSVIYHATISTSGNAYAVAGTTPSFGSVGIPEPLVRLPASVHTSFAIEVESAKTVNEVCIGESIDELRQI